MESAATRAGARPLALVAAGGEGKRLGAGGPKALVVCAGQSLLARCLDAFARSTTFGDGAGLVVVAAHASAIPAFEAACEPARAVGLDVLVTEGGPSRSHSVAAALRAGLDGAGGEEGEADRIALVHDAARIFTTARLIDSLHDDLVARSELDALIPARRVTDTIKLADEAMNVEQTPPRERLWAVQTPQAFRVRALAAVLGLTRPVDDTTLTTATDDASLIEADGGSVGLFEWNEPNGKITTPEDLATAEALLGGAQQK